MRFAVLIITYTSAVQTKRMIDALDNGQFDFYIHLDKKVDMETHQVLFDRPNVFFIKNRVDIKWAGFTTVEAAMHGIRQIRASGIKYDFVNLISGQDYPLKSAGDTAKFFSDNIGREFMLYRDFDPDWEEAKARVEKFHFTDMSFKGRYAVQSLLNFIAPKRKFPVDMVLRGKETFWTLSLDCACYVVDFIDARPNLSRFLKFTWGSDEFIFQSIIMNSHFKDAVVNKNYRYIDWPPGAARPKVLLTEDIDKLLATDSIFGRKFDIKVDENILDLLDKANGVK